MMKNTLIILISLFTFLSCTKRNEEAVILNKKIKAELDEFIALTKDHELIDESYICLYFEKPKTKLRFGITLTPPDVCSNFKGVFFYNQEPVFIYYEKQDSLTAEDVKPVMQITDSVKLKENCLEYGLNTPYYGNFHPPVWAYEIDEGEIKLIHESKLRRD
ncbi:hypothetical protein [Sinomicrobium weinanense]|uniref:Lipoprotein n=1 Tax=Sinomicrobium weinanense TaxID=2842200 RepID=A0A926JUV9_9FLAO|nr:hypothetical protein [Sinomicrobium weinanense]MBC9797658.1 hypothetical protein [Sinomicrobium weinanense]MBU3122660.1 hypothetical protein [Sinomicrobium weinanense]